MWKLISLVGQDDADILPHFLEHYRSLGIGELNVFLHGTWTGANLAPLRSADVVIAGVLPAGADVDVTSSALDAYTRRFEDEWVVIVEPDEFLELPYETLEQTVAALQSLGADELPATVLQRAAPDGRLAALSGEARPSEVFPCYDFRLAERMDGPEPIRKTKYPLVRVATGLRLPGNAHLPHTGRASAYHPIRGVLHHYHWRDRLSGAVGQGQLRIADQYEHDAYRRWLEAHDFCVPAEGLRRYSRKALFHEGHLICPTVRQSEASAALEQCRLSHWGAAEELSNAERQVAAIPNAVAQVDEGAAAYLDRRWLLTPPGRIALVTIELQGMYRSGGIGTAMAALAERLSSAGHEVHVVYCPFIGPPSLEARWVEYWSARGVRIHYLPIFKDQNRHTPPDELALKVADLLQSNEWDVIHFHETCGLGAAALLLRSAGLAFQDSRIVVTAHGPTTWHRRGNSLAWNRQEALHVLLESICVEFADVIVCPSAYMVEWLQKNLPSPVSRVVVPNCLTGESRRFGRVPAERRSVRKIVFFGRLEFRKGIDLFTDAIDRVLASGRHDFEVVLLGRAEGEMADQLTA
ncbi:MAG: glycosyltransferase, partial [Propylenella sp.]